jgi:hypothetical protein
VLAACAFPVHVWAILRLLNEIPAWLMRLSAWGLIGAIAYSLTFALFETLLLFLLLTSLSVILPSRLFRDKFVAQASMMVFLGAGWAVTTHLGLDAFRSNSRLFFAWLLLLLGPLTISYLMVHWSRKLERTTRSLVERLAPVSYMYILVDVFSMFIIVLRYALRTFT